MAANLGFDALHSAPPSERTVKRRSELIYYISHSARFGRLRCRWDRNDEKPMEAMMKRKLTFNASSLLNVFLQP